MKIIVGDMTFYGEVADGYAAREFCSMLPMTLGLTDREGSAKVFDLPVAFTQETETLSNISAGTLGLEGSGRLCLYYADGTSEEGLVPLVLLDDSSGLAQALSGDVVEVTFQIGDS